MAMDGALIGSWKRPRLSSKRFAELVGVCREQYSSHEGKTRRMGHPVHGPAASRLLDLIGLGCIQDPPTYTCAFLRIW